MSLYNGQEVFVWSDCLLDLGTDYSSLELCCEGPWFTSIQEDECDMGAHQFDLGTERNTPVVENSLDDLMLP